MKPSEILSKITNSLCDNTLEEYSFTSVEHRTGTFAGNIQKQLSQVVCVMGKHDFPEEWPDLITILSHNLTATDPDKLTSTLYTLDELCKKYRYEVKSNRLWQELVIILQAVSLWK